MAILKGIGYLTSFSAASWFLYIEFKGSIPSLGIMFFLIINLFLLLSASYRFFIKTYWKILLYFLNEIHRNLKEWIFPTSIWKIPFSECPKCSSETLTYIYIEHKLPGDCILFKCKKKNCRFTKIFERGNTDPKNLILGIYHQLIYQPHLYKPVRICPDCKTLFNHFIQKEDFCSWFRCHCGWNDKEMRIKIRFRMMGIKNPTEEMIKKYVVSLNK